MDRFGSFQGSDLKLMFMSSDNLSNTSMQVIVTSYLFPNARFSLERLQKLCEIVGKDKLVVDVRLVRSKNHSVFKKREGNSITFASCRRKDNKWIVAMNKWQTMTDMEVNKGMTETDLRNGCLRLTNSHMTESLDLLTEYCRYGMRYERQQISHIMLIIKYSEFLVHAADVEGLCKGIDQDLVQSKLQMLT